jgi:hypothetical protein
MVTNTSERIRTFANNGSQIQCVYCICPERLNILYLTIPGILGYLCNYEYNFMVERVFIFVVCVDLLFPFLCTWCWKVVLCKYGNCFEW